jgi:hypothetical protein
MVCVGQLIDRVTILLFLFSVQIFIASVACFTLYPEVCTRDSNQSYLRGSVTLSMSYFRPQMTKNCSHVRTKSFLYSFTFIVIVVISFVLPLIMQNVDI